MTTNEFIILFILPFAVMAIGTLLLKPIVPSESSDRFSGRLARYDDLHRQAYIAAVIAAIVSVVAFQIRGGPEPFVLVWKPLLSTVMVLPFGYAAALIIGAVFGMTRKA